MTLHNAPSSPISVLAFLGTGHFASYTIAALRKGGFEGSILLSPRNAEVAAKLADVYNCDVMQDNQSLLNEAEAVVLSVRPQHLQSALEGLVFRDDHLVISAVAGISLESLRAHRNLPETVVRTMPVSCIEAGDGIVPLFPPQKQAEELLSQAGALVSFETEQSFDLAMIASCMNGTLYHWMQGMVDWMQAKGLPEQAARDLVVHNIRGATAYADLHRDQHLESIGNGIATEGTYTRTALDHLKENGIIQGWPDSLEAIYKRMTDEA
ncbi:NAD(P)-binding domain-containing protein [Kiloniella sp. b19]|uniref:NAD(P)-binding domain-containing protein n=1 Tax=Kiloniella sp. GXU_MW_B19 TaxID=3141326 RepID=UPI0031D7B36B